LRKLQEGSLDAPEAKSLEVPTALAGASVVFWDFDGVIKESVAAKTAGFMWLVRAASPAVVRRVRSHHETNGGMSRYDKIPLYLTWAGQSADKNAVESACLEFSRVVYREVVDSPWVPGVYEYLTVNPNDQMFVLVSATPESEMKRLIDDLQLSHCFMGVHGSPRGKAEVIIEWLDSASVTANQALLVGDSSADYRAAKECGIPFLLRQSTTNSSLILEHCGPSFLDLVRG
jgi:phosphoglycolate phosphatase-like HAD superfamily hydrolase